jgi:hypothetical protein
MGYLLANKYAMDYTQILAAKLDLPIDYERITQEILSCQDVWHYTPPRKNQLDDGLTGKLFMVASEEDYNNCDLLEDPLPEDVTVTKKELSGPNIFYLTEHPSSRTSSDPYRRTKMYDLDGWQWRNDIQSRTQYTKSVAEQFFDKIGCVRVFIMYNTFLVTHKDHAREEDINFVSKAYDRVLGLSIIPSTGSVPMKIWSRKENKVLDIPGNAMLFNDSIAHGVPKTTGYRITIRIFGKVDYGKFEEYIDRDHLHFV